MEPEILIADEAVLDVSVQAQVLRRSSWPACGVRRGRPISYSRPRQA